MTIRIKDHVEMLGKTMEDRVTKFKGVVTSVSFDLFGCVQYLIVPEADKEGKLVESAWFDENRLEVLVDKAVMRLPKFSYPSKGPMAKPLKH